MGMKKNKKRRSFLRVCCSLGLKLCNFHAYHKVWVPIICQIVQIFTARGLLCRIRAYGSAAHNLCRVAQGSGDAYVEYGVHIWDFVAGMLIAREAGAVVKDPSGNHWHC